VPGRRRFLPRISSRALTDAAERAVAAVQLGRGESDLGQYALAARSRSELVDAAVSVSRAPRWSPTRRDMAGDTRASVLKRC
jgi:hypothetical protein